MAKAEEMKAISTEWPVIHGILWIHDPTLEELPYVDGIGALWSTKSCVVVGCLGDSEGDTSITIGGIADVGLETEPAFDSVFPTPSGKIVVETSEAEEILEMPVRGSETRIRLWTDGNPGSAFVVIGLG